ncbi:carboxypeptidase regulatory-like domain-containing protein, partial [candidate division WOR-3 bacterium]|nr:carboxypeptidase regulatory-like domain-containing protein [candidate division WOR-3 bacterium]
MKRLLAVLSVVALTGGLYAATHVHDNSILTGTGSISGTVTDSTTGLPVEGVKVAAGCCGGRYAYTNADGQYTITELAAGDYRVKATKEGYVMKMYPERVHVEEGQAVTGIDFALAPMGGGGNGSISGTVLDKATNLPVEGAKVTAGCCRNGRYAYSGADGSYTITGLADGSYVVKAMKDGYYGSTYPEAVVIQGGNAATGIDF